MTESSDAIAAWRAAADRVSWERRAERTHEAGPHGGSWFPGATLNVCVNCLDRHLGAGADRVAFHWEGEPGDRRAITYSELHADVCAFATALTGLGVGAGDRVALHLGLLPETVVAMLACARLGAVHAVMAAALPADALTDRLVDFDPKLLLTQDGSWRHGVILPLKARADEAMAAATGVEHTVVVRRTGVDVGWYEGDLWYDELIEAARARPEATPVPAVPVASDHPLLAGYIANRRGRPTGIVHGTGGLLTHAVTIHADGLVDGSDDVFWMPADIAWPATQIHAVYGPLACSATSVIYEGMLDTPTHERAWEIVERYRVNTIVTTPSVVRNLRRWSDSRLWAHDLGSLKRIVTAGERIERPLRDWLATEVGGSAIVADGWGQTELGGLVLLLDTPPGRNGLPDPGADVVDADGRSVAPGSEGELVLRHPWPGTFLRIWGDDGGAARRYWAGHPDVYATGDRAVRGPDGSLTVLGRIDPVVSVSGQLVSLTEITETLLEHPFVRAAEVVAFPDPRAGEALAACVAVRDGTPAGDQLAWALRAHVRERLGGLAHPRTIAFLEEFPEELRRDDLRRTLRLLCATAASENISLTRDQLRAAASGLLRSD
ncbi:MAG: AMP-binding protein [Thermoleophilaceae bacterium]